MNSLLLLRDPAGNYDPRRLRRTSMHGVRHTVLQRHGAECCHELQVLLRQGTRRRELGSGKPRTTHAPLENKDGRDLQTHKDHRQVARVRRIVLMAHRINRRRNRRLVLRTRQRESQNHPMGRPQFQYGNTIVTKDTYTAHSNSFATTGHTEPTPSDSRHGINRYRLRRGPSPGAGDHSMLQSS